VVNGMATSGRWDSGALARAGLFLVVSTLALTASFLGVVSVLTGGVTGGADRLPFYVLTMALAFVVAVVVFEDEFHDGRQILQLAVGAAVATFLLVTMGGEGVAFTVQHTDQVLSSQLLFYFLAAGLIGTGLGYWGLRHWEEVTGPGRGL